MPDNTDTEPPYPADTPCLACQHYNRAVIEGGPIDLTLEAEILQLWLHTSASVNGANGEGTMVIDVGSQTHRNLCRIIEGIRNQSPSDNGS